MTVHELLKEISLIKHRARVFSFLADSLQPYLDQDIGAKKTMEDDGNVVKYVPTEIVEKVLDGLHDELDSMASALRVLESYKIELPDASVKEPVTKKRKKSPIVKKSGTRTRKEKNG